MDALAMTGLSLDDHVLRYEHDTASWSVPVRDLRLIGEYTTPSGPIEDDYFLVFIDRSGKRYELPAEHATDPVINALHARLGAFDFGLASSTVLKSRIMWPPQYAEKPLFAFTRPPARTIGERVRRLFGSYSIESALSPAARAALGMQVEPDELSILVADQDPHVTALVVQAMRQRQLAIDTATTGNDAIEKISHKTYHVLLVDFRTNGIDVLRYLRETAGAAHVVLMSRQDTLPPNARHLADDILILDKPLTAKILRTSLNKYIGRAKNE